MEALQVAESADQDSLGRLIGQKPGFLAVEISLLGVILFSALLWAAMDFAVGTARGHAEKAMGELAMALASQIDVEAHERLIDRAQMDDATYRQVLAPLVRSHLALSEVRNVYTMRYREGQFWYVLDTASAPALRGRTTALVPLLARAQLTEAELGALSGAMGSGRVYVDPAPHIDTGDSLRSIQAPLRLPSGEAIGVLGIDYAEHDFGMAVGGWVFALFGVAGAVLLALTVLLGIFVYQLRRRLGDVLHRLRVESVTDGLTGLLNRRSFSAQMQQYVARTRRHGWTMTLLLLDIDHFKQINDRHGHAAGDQVLRSVADVLRHDTRGEDPVCRIGGEEFAILMQHGDVGRAEALYQRLRATLDQPIAIEGGEIRVALSGGIAQLHAADADAEDLFWRADQALYLAKKAGRNCCVVAASTDDSGNAGAG